MRFQCSEKSAHDNDVSEPKKEAIKINSLLVNFLKIHVGIIKFYNFLIAFSRNFLVNLSQNV